MADGAGDPVGAAGRSGRDHWSAAAEPERRSPTGGGNGIGARPHFPRSGKAYVIGPEEPWVIFSNGAFVGRPETGMRYFDSAHDSREAILDHYTGVGEVLAVHALDRTFGLLHRQIRVKRGSLLSLDDVKNNDMIFVGSPAENLTLREIPEHAGFCVSPPRLRPAQGRLVDHERPSSSGRSGVLGGQPFSLHLERGLFGDCAGAWLESREVGPDSGRHHDHWHAGGGRVCVSAEFPRGIAAASDSKFSSARETLEFRWSRRSWRYGARSPSRRKSGPQALKREFSGRRPRSWPSQPARAAAPSRPRCEALRTS